MDLFVPSSWPLLFVCAAMVLSAVIDWWKFKVPNWLTMPVIVSGWAFGLLHSWGGYIVPHDGVGGIWDSLAGTAMGSLLLLAYAIGGMGAGDVKMSMGFGTWVGAYYGLDGDCLGIIFYATCAGIIVGGVIAVVMILLRRDYAKNLEHTRAILTDLASTGSLVKIAEHAHARRPRWHRLPYGVPLCIGFLGYLAWWHLDAPGAKVPEIDEEPRSVISRPVQDEQFMEICAREAGLGGSIRYKCDDRQKRFARQNQKS